MNARALRYMDEAEARHHRARAAMRARRGRTVEGELPYGLRFAETDESAEEELRLSGYENEEAVLRSSPRREVY